MGTEADGTVYDASAIWQEFRSLKTQYPNARLAWSDDWASFRQEGFWVTLVDLPSAAGASANEWCDDQGFSPDRCYAKRLMTSGGYNGNTLPRD